MKTGYAWKWGPFEQIDQLGTQWFAEKLRASGMPVPALLEQTNGRPFYREAGHALQRLMPDGNYADVAVPADAWRLADVKRGKQPLIHLRASGWLWIVDRWQRHRERHQARPIESHVDLREVVDRAHQQPRANDEHDG